MPLPYGKTLASLLRFSSFLASGSIRIELLLTNKSES